MNKCKGCGRDWSPYFIMFDGVCAFCHREANPRQLTTISAYGMTGRLLRGEFDSTQPAEAGAAEGLQEGTPPVSGEPG